MKIIIEGTPKEIADFVLQVQSQRSEKKLNICLDNELIYPVENHD